MSPTLAEVFGLIIIFALVVWLGILMLPTIARIIYRLGGQAQQSSHDAERELRGEDTRTNNQINGGRDSNGKKQQG